MKLIIALCVLFVLASADDWKPKTHEENLQIREECLKEANVSDDFADKIKKYKFEDDESVRCYVKCSAKKSGIWDDKNGYNVDRFYDQMTSKAKVQTDKDNLKKCFDDKTDDEDDCKWAYRNFKCVLDNKYVTKKDD